MNAPGAELAARVATAVRAERSAKIDDLGRDAVTWLALVPLWTRSAAEAAGFPASSVTEFVKRARDAGWCETRGSLRGAGSGELRFWMPDETRRALVELLGSVGQLDGAAEVVASQVARLAQATGAAKTRDQVVLPGALRDWAELIGADRPDSLLLERVGAAVEARDLSGAQQLVSAGEAVASVIAGTMELAVDRARRLLSLGTRRRRDDRALERYLDRPELSGAVTRLLSPGSEHWALHLRGIGGAGKTMLIRYLAAGRYAAERGLPAIPIARADFDHMNPDYPVRRPVQLLLELADELSLHTAAVTGADRALAQFRATALSVHESLSGAREEPRSPLQNPLVLDAIDVFADAIAQFPAGALLILDTCEELGKADSGNPAAPAVTTTLAIIERIHQRAPSARVLFAGRWPLPGQPYLEVQEIAGFTVGEASTYLETFSERPLSGELAHAMIRQSPAADADVPGPGELPARVSPFDLALYLSWADEDPGLDVSRVAQGSDAYIEGRIIERLRDPEVVRALPVLACAGRCRVTTVAAFTGADPAALGPRLAEQEWIAAAGEPPVHVTATPALAARLRRYFDAPARAGRFAAETERFARALRDGARSVPVAEIDPDELLAALRLSSPADAARLWEETAERAGAAGRWNWLLNVTRRILGESADEWWPTAGALRATVRASYIAASRRASALFDPRASWAEVRTWADRHPDEETGRFLLTRAALGSLPYGPDDKATWAVLDAPVPLGGPLWELTAAAADCLHLLCEREAENAAARLARNDRLSAAQFSTARGWAPESNLPLTAWMLVMHARLAADTDPRAALEALSEAEIQLLRFAPLARLTAPGAGPAWPDWIPPDDPLARVRIERGLIAPPDDEELARWEPDAAGNLGSIDGERLASLCLRTRLGRGVIEPAVIEQWEQLDSYEPDRVATCSAHDLVPPLCVTLAEAWLAAGEPQRALDLVEQRRSAALETRDDEATVRLADAETVRIARRLRTFDQRALLSRLSNPRDAGRSQPELTDSAHRAWAVINRAAPRNAGTEARDRPEGWHAWWQCQSNSQVSLVFPGWAADSAETSCAADIELDVEELRKLAHPQLPRLETQLAGWLARPRPAPRARSADPFRAVRTELRRAALSEEPARQHPEVPPRVLAELAFDEAELLALRFPQQAAVLFRYACDAYQASGDTIGQVLAIASAAVLATSPADPLPPSLWSALAALRAEKPDVAAALTNVRDDGPWHYWSWDLSQLGLPKSDRAPRKAGLAGIIQGAAGAAASALARLAQWTFAAIYMAGFIAGTALIAVHLVRYDLPVVLAIAGSAVVLAAATAAVTGGWRLRDLGRLAVHRAVGTSFGPAVLGLSVLVEGVAQPGNGRLDLWAHPRPLASARRRQWARLVALGLTASARAMIKAAFEPRFRAGYSGLFGTSHGEVGELTWAGGRPEAGAAWWARGTAAGVIFLNPADAAYAWERIITASLGPQATGRIEWYRMVFVSAGHADRDATSVVLDAPEEWRRSLGGYYTAERESAPSGTGAYIQIRHAVGRAVATSAGPRLDITGDISGSAGGTALLGCEDLARGEPSLIVMQAVPVADESGTGTPDDHAEKLALAVDLIEAGAAARVLLVPALQAPLAEEVSRTIAEHAAAGRGDARRLQERLRALLRPSVPPAVLDDLVLFVNIASHYDGSRQ